MGEVANEHARPVTTGSAQAPMREWGRAMRLGLAFGAAAALSILTVAPAPRRLPVDLSVRQPGLFELPVAARSRVLRKLGLPKLLPRLPDAASAAEAGRRSPDAQMSLRHSDARAMSAGKFAAFDPHAGLDGRRSFPHSRWSAAVDLEKVADAGNGNPPEGAALFRGDGGLWRRARAVRERRHGPDGADSGRRASPRLRQRRRHSRRQGTRRHDLLQMSWRRRRQRDQGRSEPRRPAAGLPVSGVEGLSSSATVPRRRRSPQHAADEVLQRRRAGEGRRLLRQSRSGAAAGRRAAEIRRSGRGGQGRLGALRQVPRRQWRQPQGGRAEPRSASIRNISSRRCRPTRKATGRSTRRTRT